MVPVVRQALADAGIETVSMMDDIFDPGAMWASAISDAIHAADLIVVDLSHANPNVMYELGFAHALRKPTVLLASRDSGSKIPSDLAGLSTLLYDPANPSDLTRQLRNWIPALSLNRG
jgi:nucleoside 2-deoxyribosyltransferase